MKVKHYDLEINETNPFEKCSLGREQYANILTNIIKQYNNGFVLAINNKWGTGKTTFIKMWQQKLINQQYTSIYFNAWENDFEDNALTAIMGELSSLKNDNNEKDFKDMIKKGAIIAKSIVPGLVKAVAAKYFDAKELQEYLENASKGLTEIFQKDIEDYANRKKTIVEFRKELQEFIKITSPNKPIIFIVDELDRCRPNYSVSVLEQIKHFFSVPGIIFILSIDKEQLGNAVRGVYGNDRIDADEYLRRFIDIEYNIPKPDTNIYVEYLYKYYMFHEFFDTAERNRYDELRYDSERFLETSKLLFRSGDITLRQQQKIFSHARLGLKGFTQNSYVLPTVYVFFVFIREIHPELFYSLKNKTIKINEFHEKLMKLFKTDNLIEDDLYTLASLEAFIMYFVYKYYSRDYRDSISYTDDTGTKQYNINSKVKPDNSEFNRLFPYLDRIRTELNLILKKIELLEFVE